MNWGIEWSLKHSTRQSYRRCPNLVEVCFGIIDRQAIRRGVFTSVQDLNTKIRGFINSWNDRKHPFVWTKTANEILKRPTINQFQKRDTSISRYSGNEKTLNAAMSEYSNVKFSWFSNVSDVAVDAR